MQAVTNQNKEMREKQPDIDKHVKELSSQLEILSSTDLTAATFMKSVIVPRDPVSEAIIKYQIKLDSHQDTLFAIKNIEGDISSDFLKKVRKISSKQFKCLFRRERLLKAQQPKN